MILTGKVSERPNLEQSTLEMPCLDAHLLMEHRRLKGEKIAAWLSAAETGLVERVCQKVLSWFEPRCKPDTAKRVST